MKNLLKLLIATFRDFINIYFKSPDPLFSFGYSRLENLNDSQINKISGRLISDGIGIENIYVSLLSSLQNMSDE